MRERAAVVLGGGGLAARGSRRLRIVVAAAESHAPAPARRLELRRALPRALSRSGAGAIAAGPDAPSRRLDSRDRACVDRFAASSGSLATRSSSSARVVGASLTFMDAGRRVVLGCDRTRAPRADGAWCARIGRPALRRSRWTTPGSTSSARPAWRAVGFAWLEPAPSVRWVVVDGAAVSEVESVAAGLPVRVATRDVDGAASSATFAVTEYDAKGRSSCATGFGASGGLGTRHGSDSGRPGYGRIRRRDRALPEVPPTGFRRGRRPGSRRPDAPQRDRARPGPPGVPLRRPQGHGQDVDGPDPGQGAQLRRPGPTTTPDGTCQACVSISAGTSLDVVEMDAASQRGIDDIREIRERVVLQPAEGRHKVYILDEAHQLTDAAWNALLKLIEEPPPHLVFVFCTTDLAKVLPTVRSRCQTFVFQRPRFAELSSSSAVSVDGEGIEAQNAALALIARSAHGSFRDAVSTLDQLASADYR